MDQLKKLEERIEKADSMIGHLERKITDVENRRKNVIVFNISRIPNEFVKVIFEAMENGDEVIVTPRINDVEIRRIKKNK